MTESRVRFQVASSAATLNRAKAVAYGRGLTLTEFVLKAIAKEGNDEQLKKLVEEDLATRKKTGAQPDKSDD
jgi:hypothetical protein